MRANAVFARPPVPGRVKTRLSPALPAALACDLSRAMLEDTLEAALAADLDRRFIFWADPLDANAGFEIPPGFEPRLQQGDGLGERIEHAFGALLEGSRARAIVIGSDCPELRAPRINEAVRALETHDLVLGPTEDGGYYLIGLSRPAPALFRELAWSTGSVFEQTRARAKGAGLSIAVLPALADLDTPADLAALVARTLVTDRDGLGRHTRDAMIAMSLLPEGSRA